VLLPLLFIRYEQKGGNKMTKKEALTICKCIKLLEVDGDDTKAKVSDILKQLLEIQNEHKERG